VSLATALHPPTAIYREEQNFGWWVYALLAVMLLLTWAGTGRHHAVVADPAPPVHRLGLEVPVGLAVGLTLPAVLVVGVLRMTTEVTPIGVRVWFGWLPTFRRSVPISAIQRLEVVRYRPIRDTWGWGVRRGPDDELVLNARGDRGVRLHLADGSRLLIGSQRPEALASALHRAIGIGA